MIDFGPGNIVRKYFPQVLVGVSVVFLILLVAIAVAFNGVSPRSGIVTSILFSLAVTGPFIAVIGYGGYWLRNGSLSSDRFPRIGAWFGLGTVGFSLLNVFIMVSWIPFPLHDYLSWGLFAAAFGGAGGLGIGIFEARAINRAVTAERYRIQRQELQKRNDRLGEFAGVVAHDIRNPLGVAAGRLELAQNECTSTHLDSMSTSFDRIETIVDRTLALARAGRVVSGTELVGLSELGWECWQTVDTANAELVVEESVSIEGDADRLRNLFENLFRNAIEHGGTDVNVSIGAIPNGFFVEDDGPGIPVAERKAVLSPGYTTTGTGTGLGLAIVNQIADAHGWAVTITDGTDSGARFEFTPVNERVRTSQQSGADWNADTSTQGLSSSA